MQASSKQGFVPADHLRDFVAGIVRERGFRGAARVLGISPTTAGAVAMGLPVRLGSLALIQLRLDGDTATEAALATAR